MPLILIFIVLSMILRYLYILLQINFVSSDPFHWAWLPMAEEVFSKETRDLVVPKLQSTGFISGLEDDLFELFSVSIYTCIHTTEITCNGYLYRKIEDLIEGCFIGKCLF